MEMTRFQSLHLQLLDELGFVFINQQQKSEAGLLSNCTTAPKNKK
jgi:hypothetical protein